MMTATTTRPPAAVEHYLTGLHRLLGAGRERNLRRRVSWKMLFALVFAFVLGYGQDVALAQNQFVVDGDRRDWATGEYLDSFFDVIPDSNNSIDIISYAAVEDYSGHIKREGREFYFLLRFLEPPFQDTTTTSVELFFDVSADSTFGEPTPPWVDFLPDYRIEIIGRNGGLTQEIYRRLVGDQWVATKGENLSEVEAAHSGQYLEGAIPWAALGNPGDTEEEKERGYFYFKWAIKTTQDGSHDYLPDGDNLQFPWSPMGGTIVYTSVELRSWGWIKGNARSQDGLE